MADPSDDDAVGRLMATTGADLGQAQFLLEAANGNVDAAAHMYFGGFSVASSAGALAVLTRMMSTWRRVWCRGGGCMAVGCLLSDRKVPPSTH
jgi:hypothetical protein